MDEELNKTEETNNEEIKQDVENQIPKESEIQENSKVDSVEENSEKEVPQIVPENKIGALISGKNKKPSWKPLVIVMIFSLFIVFFWENIPIIKESVHAVLDPSAGALLQWNIPYGLEIGMLIITLFIALLTTLAQKYGTDQATLKELRKEQKILQKKTQEFKHQPEKMMEMQKEIMPLTMKTMQLSTRAMAFTGIPFLLFFRWFHDFFTQLGDPKFFGVMGWFWFYFIAVIVFSSILRKVLKVV